MTPSPPSFGTYTSGHSRAQVVTALLIAGAVISGLIIFAEIGQLVFPEFSEGQDVADNPGGLAALIFYALLTLLGLAVFVATAIVFLMWLHRCSSNLRAFSSWPTGYSPAWAVGCFFVPFANLFMPYQAVKEIWEKSQPPDPDFTSFSASPPGFLSAWWGFWIASNITTNIHFRMSGKELREAAIMIGIVSEVLSIAAAALAVQVIKAIDRRQKEAIEHVRPNEQFPVPPPPPVFDPAGGFRA